MHCSEEVIPKLECPVLFWGYFDLELSHISYIVGGRIPNLVCGYILGLHSVTHCFFYITVILTSGLIYGNLLSLGAFFVTSQTVSL